MSDLKARFGQKIKELRALHGLSQVELAEAINVAHPTIVSIEKGKAPTNLDVIERLAKQLGVTPASLLESPAAVPAQVRKPSPDLKYILDTLATVDDAKHADLLTLIAKQIKRGLSGRGPIAEMVGEKVRKQS